MPTKEILGYLSIVCAIVSMSGYFWSIYKKRTKPHVFSWLVWGIVMIVVFFAQFKQGGGPGAWVTGFSALIQFVVAGLAVFIGEKNITRSDWLAFVGALATIPLWYATKDPLSAVVLATTIDAFAYYPTFRKSWLKPYEENWFAYVVGTLQWIPALFALGNYSAATVLYPTCIMTINLSLAAMLLVRRAALK